MQFNSVSRVSIKNDFGSMIRNAELIQVRLQDACDTIEEYEATIKALRDDLECIEDEKTELENELSSAREEITQLNEQLAAALNKE